MYQAMTQQTTQHAGRLWLALVKQQDGSAKRRFMPLIEHSDPADRRPSIA